MTWIGGTDAFGRLGSSIPAFLTVSRGTNTASGLRLIPVTGQNAESLRNGS